MTTALHNLQIISDGQITRGKAVLISGGKILNIVSDNAIPQDANKIDLNGAFLAPGLIDLQIYGTGGKLFAGTPEEAALEQMENDMLSQGTVGFFATLGTNSNDVVEKGIEVAKAYRDKAKGNFWGMHLEGP